MKQLITNALKAKGIDTDGKSDAELMDAYNQMIANESKGEETPEEKAAREKKSRKKRTKRIRPLTAICRP